MRQQYFIFETVIMGLKIILKTARTLGRLQCEGRMKKVMC